MIGPDDERERADIPVSACLGDERHMLTGHQHIDHVRSNPSTNEAGE
jgi:hypothetical protein